MVAETITEFDVAADLHAVSTPNDLGAVRKPGRRRHAKRREHYFAHRGTDCPDALSRYLNSEIRWKRVWRRLDNVERRREALPEITAQLHEIDEEHEDIMALLEHHFGDHDDY